MELSGFYKVTVKIENEVDDGKGNSKIKKSKEVYIVDNCGDPQSAVDVVEKAFSNYGFTWAVESVKEEKITEILHRD